MISELTRSSHGDLDAYTKTARAYAEQDIDFLSHLISWNAEKGHVRDSKISLPIVALGTMAQSVPKDYIENAHACLALLSPRDFLRAVRYAKNVLPAADRMRGIRRLVERYLRAREANAKWWVRSVLQHKRSMKELYSLFHVKPGVIENNILFGKLYPTDGVYRVFNTVKHLSLMNDMEAAGSILNERIPFLVARGALGKRISHNVILMSLIESMSPQELVTNTKQLVNLGLNHDPILRAAFDEKLEKSRKHVSLKASRAVEVIDDEAAKSKLEMLQERQLENMKGQSQVEGNWLVLGDKSGSMSQCIETAKEVAGILTKMVKGKVHLIFFDTEHRYFDVTGSTYENIKHITRSIHAQGGTSIGVGLRYCVENNIEVDGIAVVSDGAENTYPYFADVYHEYAERFGKNVPVYFYHIPSDDHLSLPTALEYRGIEYQQFDVSQTDFYSLPNLIQTMRSNRYSLVDEIYSYPLRALADVFKDLPGQIVIGENRS